MSNSKKIILEPKDTAEDEHSIQSVETIHTDKNVEFADNLPSWDLLPQATTIKRIRRNI